MKMHIRFEGTPEEIGGVLQSLPTVAALQTTAVELVDEPLASTIGPEPVESEIKTVTTPFARRVLNRRRLSAPMRAVLQALAEASPGWVALPELHEIAGYAPAQFAGLMGAFGRRMASTDGYNPEAHFFLSRWSEEGDAWEYGLPDTVREAIALEGIV